MSELLNIWGRKKTKVSYRKSLMIRTLGFLIAAIALFMVELFLTLTSFTKGLLFGIILSFVIIILKNLFILSNGDRLRDAYLKHYDERNYSILLKASAIGLSIHILFMIIYIFLFAFLQLKMSLMTFIIIDLYVILFSVILSKITLEKLM